MILGHENIFQELKRLAAESRLTHSYLFLGSEGIGKSAVARAFASYLEFGGKEPAIILSDSFVIELGENHSIGIDAIREIKNFLWQTPNRSEYRTVIINESESLTGEAQNALLKITEEPPPAALIILVAKDAESLQPTLVSRLARIYFSPLATDAVRLWLQKEKKLSASDAAALAAQSFGKPGLALRLLEDEKFKARLAAARGYLGLREAAARNEALKEFQEDESFNFPEFLDALIFVVAQEIRRGRSAAKFWHRLLTLRRNADFFNLNPRIQLENLISGR